MFRFLSNNASDQEKEKNKDFRNVVIIQVVIIVSGLVLSTFINYADPSFGDKLIITLFSGFASAAPRVPGTPKPSVAK